MTYETFCSTMTWPAAQHYVSLLNSLVPVGEEVVFLTADSSEREVNTYDVILMDQYRYVESKFINNNDRLNESSVSINVHLRTDVSTHEIKLSQFNIFPVAQGYSNMQLSINFKDDRDPIQISAQKFRLSEPDFFQVASTLTR